MVFFRAGVLGLVWRSYDAMLRFIIIAIPLEYHIIRRLAPTALFCCFHQLSTDSDWAARYVFLNFFSGKQVDAWDEWTPSLALLLGILPNRWLLRD